MNTEAPILVTGCSRSGASMIAAAINACGAFGGVLNEPNQNIKRGMFENVHIREDLVKPLLVSRGADPAGQFPLVSTNRFVLPSGYWGKAIEMILREEGYEEGKWLYKDSRSALIWPIWHATYPDAKWVIVRRRTGDVVSSCVKTGFMKGFKKEYNRRKINVTLEEEAWLWWVHEYEKRFEEMISAGVNCREIWPQRMVNGDYRQMHEIIEWLGLKWTDEALNFIYPLLWGKQKERK